MSATGPSLRLAAMASVDDAAHEARVFLEANHQITTADLRPCGVFERSPLATAHLGAEMVRIFSAAKRQEHERLTGIVPAAEHGAYLRTV